MLDAEAAQLGDRAGGLGAGLVSQCQQCEELVAGAHENDGLAFVLQPPDLRRQARCGDLVSARYERAEILALEGDSYRLRDKESSGRHRSPSTDRHDYSASPSGLGSQARSPYPEGGTVQHAPGVTFNRP